MIAALLLTIAQVPTPEPIPVALRGGDVMASVQMSATHFAAQSHTHHVQWILFANPTSGLRTMRGLAPFGSLLYPIAEDAAGEFVVEVLVREESGRFATSGVFDCEMLIGKSLFVERRAKDAVGWIAARSGRSLRRAATSHAMSVTHVPVPLPSENKKKSKSRRIEKKKLPPF